MKTIVGIDYGAKLAGTTVVAYQKWEENTPIQFLLAAKKKDADAFLLTTLVDLKVSKVFFDAPLSLPFVYTKPEKGEDYFYRKADKLLGAMSPMFLGGLTARAMRLQSQLHLKGIELVETYPAYHARKWNLKNLGYKGKKENLVAVCEKIKAETNLHFTLEEVQNWHYVDAILALWSAVKWERGEGEVFGDLTEGGIWV